MTFFVCGVFPGLTKCYSDIYQGGNQFQLKETIEVMTNLIVRARHNDVHHFSVFSPHFQWIEPYRTAFKINKQVFVEFLPGTLIAEQAQM